MVSITFPINDNLAKGIEHFSWVSWSEVAREELKKKAIFEKYLKTRNISDQDWKFCEKIDWHPVDELPFKESFLKELKEIRKEKSVRARNVEDLFN